jgi:hypothetical protein
MKKYWILILSLFYICFLFLIYYYISNFINSKQAQTLFTPELVFPCVINCEKLLQYNNIGKNLIKKSTVVFAGLIRNKEHQLEFIISQIQRFASEFLDYSILIVENDSKDNTRKLLLEWAKENNKVKILGCGVNSNICIMNLSGIMLIYF